MDPVLNDIVDWLNEHCTQGRPGAAIEADTQLLECGLLDSLHFLNLVTYIEERYNFTIDEELLVPENFISPAAVVQLINKMPS